MRNLLPIVLLLLTSLARGAGPAPARLTVVVGSKESSFSLAELKKALKPRSVTLTSPIYEGPMTYDAFGFDEVLALAGVGAQTQGDEIVFTASDGYSPNTSFTSLKTHPAIIAFQEHGKKAGGFTLFKMGKGMLNPAPFLVAWTEGKALGDQVPWPVALVRIEVVRFAEKFDQMYPKDTAADSKAMKGFIIFKNECLRCHSINLQGGTIGPELNAPRSITEYWDRGVLRDYIRKVSDFRYKDKMPDFPQLKDPEMDELVEYLGYMKNHKIKL